MSNDINIIVANSLVLPEDCTLLFQDCQPIDDNIYLPSFFVGDSVNHYNYDFYPR